MRTVEQLELGFARIEGAQACRNLMGMFSHYFATADAAALMGLWSGRKDVRLKYKGRAFTGEKEVRSCLVRHLAPRHGSGPLTVRMYDMDTPVLEVAGDGLTAKGCWTSSGHETTPNGLDGKNGEARWRWARYAADFVKEPDGTWKIWHLVCVELFSTPWNEPWTNHPWPENAWKPNAAFPMDMPMLPEPYETFRDTFVYC